jgi:hypothetical protein
MRIVHHYPWTAVIALGALRLVACDVDVAVKPRGDGTEFAIASIQIDKRG